MLQTPSRGRLAFLSNKRSFCQNECLWSLQTNFYRMLGEICFCLLLATSVTASNLLNWTGEASGCLLVEGHKFRYVIAAACKKAKKGVFWERISRFFMSSGKVWSLSRILHYFWLFYTAFWGIKRRGSWKTMPVAMAIIGKTLSAHFRQVLHASAQYDQARTVFHRLKKRLEMSNLCSLSWDQTVTFSDLAHWLSARARVCKCPPPPPPPLSQSPF